MKQYSCSFALLFQSFIFPSVLFLGQINLATSLLYLEKKQTGGLNLCDVHSSAVK